MKKNIYRAQNVNNVNIEKLHNQVKDQRIVLGIDVAKEDMCSVIMDDNQTVLVTIKWDHPTQSRQMLDLLTSLPSSVTEVALEPTGTYGDSFRYQLEQNGFPIYRVSTKKSSDYNEIYDDVPSSHDAKSAAVVADLHLTQKSSPWHSMSDDERTLRAAVDLMANYDEHCHRQLNRLEAILSRHWPELPTILSLDSASLLELVLTFGSPQAVAANLKDATTLLRRVGGPMLAQDKIDRVVSSAHTTLGVHPNAEECQLIKCVAREARQASKKAKKAKDKVENLIQENEVVSCMGEAVGKVTAAVLFSYLGDPTDYSCANAYLKAAGLNLKERSSGKYKGQLKITKRGPSIVRQYLYLAVLRKIQDDACFRAWHERKIERDGGTKIKSIVALMRKLLKALFHVGHGEVFDSSCLFDLKRLNITEQ